IAPRRLSEIGWRMVQKEPLILDHHLERDLGSVFFNSWLATEGAAIVEHEQPDFLYERYSLFGWGGVELSRRYGIPLILAVDDPLCVEQAGYEKFTMTSTAERMEKETICAADAIVAISQWVADWVVSLGVDRTRVHVIPNGVDGQLFDHRAS